MVHEIAAAGQHFYLENPYGEVRTHLIAIAVELKWSTVQSHCNGMNGDVRLRLTARGLEQLKAAFLLRRRSRW